MKHEEIKDIARRIDALKEKAGRLRDALTPVKRIVPDNPKNLPYIANVIELNGKKIIDGPTDSLAPTERSTLEAVTDLCRWKIRDIEKQIAELENSVLDASKLKDRNPTPAEQTTSELLSGTAWSAKEMQALKTLRRGVGPIPENLKVENDTQEARDRELLRGAGIIDPEKLIPYIKSAGGIDKCAAVPDLTAEEQNALARFMDGAEPPASIPPECSTDSGPLVETGVDTEFHPGDVVWFPDNSKWPDSPFLRLYLRPADFRHHVVYNIGTLREEVIEPGAKMRVVMRSNCEAVMPAYAEMLGSKQAPPDSPLPKSENVE